MRGCDGTLVVGKIKVAGWRQSAAGVGTRVDGEHCGTRLGRLAVGVETWDEGGRLQVLRSAMEVAGVRERGGGAAGCGY